MFGGRYTLVRQLGRGGMGEVWLAQDNELAVERCLKFAPVEVASDAKSVAILKREAISGTSLSHPSIVRIFDFVSDHAEKISAVVMEVVDGRSLADLQAERIQTTGDGFFEAREVEAWVEQACAALEYAHREKRVHRDLKPQNLLIESATGKLKIVDFGISRRIGDSMSQLTGKDSSGTMPYMSPQQLAGENVSEQDDVYGLGATIFDLLTGSPPFTGGSLESQIKDRIPSSMMERRRYLHQQGGNATTGGTIPEFWEKAVRACLSKDLATRPKTLMAAFDKGTPPPKRSKTGMRASLLAACGLAILGTWIWFDGHQGVGGKPEQGKKALPATSTQASTEGPKARESQPGPSPQNSQPKDGKAQEAAAADAPPKPLAEAAPKPATPRASPPMVAASSSTAQPSVPPPAVPSADAKKAPATPPVSQASNPPAPKPDIGKPHPFDASTLSDEQLRTRVLYPIIKQARFEGDPLSDGGNLNHVRFLGMGMCDDRGNIFIEPVWDNLDFDEPSDHTNIFQLMVATQNGREVLINRLGRPVLAELEADSYELSADQSRVIVNKQQVGDGLYLPDGSAIVPMMEDQYLSLNDKNYILRSTGSSKELLDPSGKMIRKVETSSRFIGNDMIVTEHDTGTDLSVSIIDVKSGRTLRHRDQDAPWKNVRPVFGSSASLLLATTKVSDNDSDDETLYALARPDGTLLTEQIWTSASALKGNPELIDLSAAGMRALVDEHGNTLLKGDILFIDRVTDSRIAIQRNANVPVEIFDIGSLKSSPLKDWERVRQTKDGLIVVAKQRSQGDYVENVIDANGDIVLGGDWESIEILGKNSFIAAYPETKEPGPRYVLVNLKDGIQNLSARWSGMEAADGCILLIRTDKDMNLDLGLAKSDGTMVWQDSFPAEKPLEYKVGKNTIEISLVRDVLHKELPKIGEQDPGIKFVELRKAAKIKTVGEWFKSNADGDHDITRAPIDSDVMEEAKDVLPVSLGDERPEWVFSTPGSGSFVTYSGGIVLEVDEVEEKVVWGTKLQWVQSETVTWVAKKDDILYVTATSLDAISTGTNTEPALTPEQRADWRGSLGQMAAIRRSDKKLLWKTVQGVCNSFNFIVFGDYIICGFGGTQLDDYVRVLDRHTGWELAKQKVSSMPMFFAMKGTTLSVRCYDADYTFGMGRTK